MNDWTAGYVADIGYTFGYYSELNPLRVKLAFLNAGLVPPETLTACELGFGQGLSSNIHAAASMTGWYGTDFNPAQAGFAQELAGVSGSGAKLYDDAFADFAQRQDLPDFDFIGIHGIWSWISDANRQVIVDFIRRKLKIGGVLYISYNTMPGWSSFAPIRHLMTEHAELIGSEGHGIVSRINGALAFTEKLLATNPAYAVANPQVVGRLQQIKAQNPHYLAHEYFNRDWHPMHFGTVADWLSPAKVSFACSAHYLDHVGNINLNAEQQAFLNDINDPQFREGVRDFMVNQQFRRDYWVKGARTLSRLELVEAFRGQRLILTTPRPDISLKVKAALGEAEMSQVIYNPILNALADHKPKTIAQIEQAIQQHGINFVQLTQAIIVLAGVGHLAAVQEDSVVNKVKKQTDKLNLYLINKARGGQDISFLASPLTGSGIAVGRFEQLFLLAQSQGHKQPEQLAQFVWQVISAQGQKILKENKVLETAEENILELNLKAKAFLEKQLPILKSLLIA